MQVLSKGLMMSSAIMCSTLIVPVSTSGLDYETTLPNNDKVYSSTALESPISKKLKIHSYKFEEYEYAIKKQKQPVIKFSAYLNNKEGLKAMLDPERKTIEVLPSDLTLVNRRPMLDAQSISEIRTEGIRATRKSLGTIQASSVNISIRKNNPLA